METRGTNIDKLASQASVRANIVVGRPANRSIGTMDSLLFPHEVLAVHIQGTPTELSNRVPKKARLLTSKQSDNRQGKKNPAKLSWSFPVGTRISPLEDFSSSCILANAGRKT